MCYYLCRALAAPPAYIILNYRLMEPAILDQLKAAINKIKELVPPELLLPKVAIICGSGLSTLGSAIVDRIDIPYTDIPGFLTSHGTLHRYYGTVLVISFVLLDALQFQGTKAY